MFGMNTATLVIIGVFMLVGVILTLVGIFNLVKASASKRWPSTNGKVIDAKVRVSTSTDNEGSTSTSYVPHIEYEYRVNNAPYTSTRRTIGSGQTGYGSRNRANAIVEQYPVGKSVPVYYDPQNPKYGVLQTGFAASVFIWLLLGIGFLCLPLVLGVLFSTALK